MFINFLSLSFLIFLFVALADLSMGKKGALGKLFRRTSRTLVFYNAHLPKLLLKLMRKKNQTNETEQKQLAQTSHFGKFVSKVFVCSTQ